MSLPCILGDQPSPTLLRSVFVQSFTAILRRLGILYNQINQAIDQGIGPSWVSEGALYRRDLGPILQWTSDVIEARYPKDDLFINPPPITRPRANSRGGGRLYISNKSGGNGLRSAARNYKATRQRTRPWRTTKSSAKDLSLRKVKLQSAS